MSLNLRTPAVEQRWTCHGCSICCRGTIVTLDDEDLRKLREQRWDEHPDFRGVQTVVREGLGGRWRLAKRPDGSCVFLMDDGRCRIHAEHGLEAKPWLCQTFPRQIVPLGEFAYLTMRRHCPSAARDQGEPVDEHRKVTLALYESRGKDIPRTVPPAVTRTVRRPWGDVLLALQAFERLMRDERFPPVRRLVHGLMLADALERCRMARLDDKAFRELLSMLGEAAVKEGAAAFRDRRPTSGITGPLFRQTALEYAWLHPHLYGGFSWSQRFRMIRAALGFARGRGTVPTIHPSFPRATFEELEAPLGALPAEVLHPIHRYLEVAAASGQYAILGRKNWSVVDSFRGLALSFAVGMWLLRWLSVGDRPTEEMAVGIVGTLDRAQGYAPLAGPRHRQRVIGLARRNALPGLVAWYVQ